MRTDASKQTDPTLPKPRSLKFSLLRNIKIADMSVPLAAAGISPCASHFGAHPILPLVPRCHDTLFSALLDPSAECCSIAAAAALQCYKGGLPHHSKLAS